MAEASAWRGLPRALAAWVLAPMLALAGGAGVAALAAEAVGVPTVRLASVTLPKSPAILLRPAVEAAPARLIWEGADLDGDGAADFANPTGRAPRIHDAYGAGAFGASRDGGSRRHEGVDYMAEAGQDVAAPISGVVTRIGYAYADDAGLQFVEISNPATGFQARAFYVDPAVQEGDAVAVGQAIGQARSLQAKYPGGMTNHVHLEIRDGLGRELDAASIIRPRWLAAAAGA